MEVKRCGRQAGTNSAETMKDKEDKKEREEGEENVH